MKTRKSRRFVRSLPLGYAPRQRAILSVFRKEPEGRWVLFRDANMLTPVKSVAYAIRRTQSILRSGNLSRFQGPLRPFRKHDVRALDNQSGSHTPGARSRS